MLIKRFVVILFLLTLNGCFTFTALTDFYVETKKSLPPTKISHYDNYKFHLFSKNKLLLTKRPLYFKQVMYTYDYRRSKTLNNFWDLMTFTYMTGTVGVGAGIDLIFCKYIFGHDCWSYDKIIQTDELIACNTQDKCKTSVAASNEKIMITTPDLNILKYTYTDVDGVINIDESFFNESLFTINDKNILKIHAHMVSDPEVKWEKTYFLKELAYFKNIILNKSPVLFPKDPPYPFSNYKIQSHNVSSGDITKINIEVENKGKGDINRLRGKLTCDDKTISVSEENLFFGHIPKGQKRIVQCFFKVPLTTQSGKKIFNVSFTEHNSFIPENIHSYFNVKELSSAKVRKLYEEDKLNSLQIKEFLKQNKLSKPIFSYSYHILDDGSGKSTGNADGIFQRGEAVEVVFSISNTGNVKTGNSKIKLIFDEDKENQTKGLVFFNKECLIGNIQAGDSKIARFTIALQRSYQWQKISIPFVIEDDVFHTRIVDKININVETNIPKKIIPINIVVKTIKPTILYSGASDRSSEVGEVANGEYLITVGEMGNWYKIKLSENSFAWILKSETKHQYNKAMNDEDSTESKKLKNNFFSNYKPKIIKIFQKSPPIISLFLPEKQNIKTSKSFIILQGSAFDDQNVSQINFLINDQSVPNVRAIQVDRTINKRSIKFKEQINIPVGRSIITIVATDNESLQSKTDIFVERTSQTGEIFACFIGINNYLHFKPLTFAVRDAESYANFFQKSMEISDKNIFLILNENATEKNIKSILGTKLKNMAGRNDTVLIFYAGHGGIEKNSQSPDGDGLEKYLLPVNAKPDDLYSTAISFNEVRTIFDRIKSDRIIFIIDSCFSGSAGGRTIASLGLRSSLDNNSYQRLAQGKGRVIITASEPNEVSIEDQRFGGGHGVFTYYWLESLKGHADMNRDGYITISEAYSYTYKKVGKETNQNQHPMKKGEFSGEIYIGKVLK